MNTQKYDYIDVVRGIAILLVVLVHTSQSTVSNFPPFFSHLISFGSKGVQLFFIASALTLFLSFKNRAHKEKKPVKNFFIRRFLRIAPIYYLGICYYLFQDGFGPRYWLGDANSISNLNIVSNITFTNGINPYWITSLVPGGWSITCEMFFYALIPILFLKIKNSNQAINFLILTLLIKIGLQEFFVTNPFLIYDRLWREYLYFYFPSQLPIFAFGILLFFLINESIPKISFTKFFVLLLLIFIQVGLQKDFLYIIHILFGILFVTFVYYFSKGYFNFLINPVFKFLGKISFSLYISHFAVIHWLGKFEGLNFISNSYLNLVLNLVIVLFFSSIVSYLLYRIIELNFLKISSILTKE